MFEAKLSITSAVPAFSAGGRIAFWFPRKNSFGADAFSNNLGFTKTGDEIPCWFDISEGFIQPETAKKLLCRLIKSELSNEPAKVEIVNFDAITTTKKLHVQIVNIMNPANAISFVDISVMVFQEVSGATTYINFDTFKYFIDCFDSSASVVDYNPTLTGDEPALNTGAVQGSTNTYLKYNLLYSEALGANDMFILTLPSIYT